MLSTLVGGREYENPRLTPCRTAETDGLPASVLDELFFFFLFEERGGGGDAVVVVEAEQANALRGAAGLADFLGMNADDFALAGDDHDVGLFAHLERRHHRAVAVGGLQVDDTLAAARGDAILGERGALAVALLGDGKDQRGERLADFVALQLVEILCLLLELVFDDAEIGL